MQGSAQNYVQLAIIPTPPPNNAPSVYFPVSNASMPPPAQNAPTPPISTIICVLPRAHPLPLPLLFLTIAWVVSHHVAPAQHPTPVYLAPAQSSSCTTPPAYSHVLAPPTCPSWTPPALTVPSDVYHAYRRKSV